MDLLSILAILILSYLLICFLLSFFLDADLTTSFYDKIWSNLSGELQGKVIWITGASGGIGSSIAEEAALLGAKLVLSGRRKQELERVKTSCLEAGRYHDLKSEEVLVIPIDIAKFDKHDSAVKVVLAKLGKISSLIHCIGRAQKGRWEHTDIAVDKELFEVNVFGIVHLSRLVLPHMTQRGSGSFGVVTCVDSVLGVPFSGSYNASKQALCSYFSSLRNEKVGNGITVSFLIAGPTVSNLMDTALNEVLVGHPKKRKESAASSANQEDDVTSQKKRMSAKRCGHLCLVGLAHKLPSSWICSYPSLSMMYLHQYMPALCIRLMSLVGPRYVARMRGTNYGSINDQ